MRRFLRHPLSVLVATLIAGSVAAAAPRVTSTGVIPAGWSAGDRADVWWTLTDATAATTLRVEMNSAPDGSADGSWVALAGAVPAGDGPGAAHIALDGAQGRRAIRVVASDGGGTSSAYAGTLLLDRDAPRLRTAAVVERAPERATYEWVVVDDVSGVVPDAHVEVAFAADGSAGGAVSSSAVAAGPGTVRVTVTAAGLDEGPHAVALVTRDLAGNTVRLALPALIVDRTPPLITGVHVQQVAGAATWSAQLGYTATDSVSGIADDAQVVVVDTTDGRVLGRARGGPGEQWVAFDLPRAGVTQVALRIADRTGNVGESRVVSLDPSSPVGPLGDDPRSRLLRAADLRVAARSGGGPYGELVRVRAGRGVRVGGVLRAADGSPLAGEEVEVRDARDRRLGGTITGADGAFTLRVSPLIGGRLTVGVPVGGELLPDGAGVDARLVPVLRLTASAQTLRAGGGPVTLRAQVSPTPATAGVAYKNVVFEWRDPFRGTWRPMVNTRLDHRGRAIVRWRFNAGGFRVPVRLRLPGEPGWPSEPAVSRSVTLIVR